MNTKTKSGFTLVELLVVIAIIGVLLAIAFPAIQSARGAARRIACSNSLRNLSLGLHHYHDVHKVFPPGNFRNGPGAPLATGWGWTSMLLPFIEQRSLHQKIDFGQPTGAGSNSELLKTKMPFLNCPSDGSASVLSVGDFEISTGNYVGSSGARGLGLPGLFYENSKVRMRDITDGTSQTFLLGERVNQESPVAITSGWFGLLTSPGGYHVNSISHLDVTPLVPINMSFDFPACFSSYHTRGAQFAYCDGSTHFVNQDIDLFVFQALGSRSGQDNAAE